MGYCQGLNYVASMLLNVFHNCEDTFVALCNLINRVEGYYKPGMTQLLSDIDQLDTYIAMYYPSIKTSFVKKGIELNFLTTEWFHCLFVTSFPLSVSLRIWDILIAGVSDETHHAPLPRIAIAALRIISDQTKRDDFDDIMRKHKHITRSYISHNDLINLALTAKLNKKGLPLAKTDDAIATNAAAAAADENTTNTVSLEDMISTKFHTMSHAQQQPRTTGNEDDRGINNGGQGPVAISSVTLEDINATTVIVNGGQHQPSPTTSPFLEPQVTGDG